MSLNGRFQLIIDMLQRDALDLHNRESTFRQQWGPTVADGNGADQGQVLYADTISLADGANTTLDFYDGSLVDVNGNALTMTELKGLVIRNRSADATLLIGAAAGTQLPIFGDAASDKISLPPGSTGNPSIFMLCVPSATGYAISSAPDLKLEHNGTGSSAMLVDVVAWGSD